MSRLPRVWVVRLLLVFPAAFAAAGMAAAQPVETSVGTTASRSLVKSQHLRLPFAREIQRVAVGDADILSAELLTNREVLVLGRETGRTTLIVWFTNGSIAEYVFSVHRDFSVLAAALQRVHPSIGVESAPDRDAVVLTGLVSSVALRQAAEAVARDYLEAGATRRSAARPLMAAPPAPIAVPPADGTVLPGAPDLVPSAPSAVDTVRLEAAVAPSGRVINLIRLETLPALPEEKIAAAIGTIGGEHVTVRRMMRGDVRDDAADTLVLEGRVVNQVALVRILALAAQLFTGKTVTDDDIRVLANESGALASQDVTTPGAQQSAIGGGVSSSLFGGGSRSLRLTNQVQRNLGRAKAVEAAGGRLLSFIEVSDLPQIRVEIRLVEVNRNKLRSFTPNSALLTADFRQPSLNAAQAAAATQGSGAARVGSGGTEIQNVLSFLGGALLNQAQFSGGHAAIDMAVALLEREGIARSLSSPSLTVLSGELAQVQIGGEVPVSIAFSPSLGGAQGPGGPAGVFSSVEFVPFGVQLQIRPLVGDDDTITLDVQPQVVTPDAALTDAIRVSTGGTVPTTAFQTRALRTSSRLQDGQALLIGGLTSNTISTSTASVPRLRDAPLLGRLFQGFNHSDDSTDLVIVVNPVVLRTALPDAALWAFPGHGELLSTVLGAGAAVETR